MCELLGMSARNPTDLNASLALLRPRGGQVGPHADGWGVAFYEGRAARIFKEPIPAVESRCLAFIAEEDYRSTIVIGHIRRANPSAYGRSSANTHPFTRELFGQSWVFAHNGKLQGVKEDARFALHRFHPTGDTDSEHAFCYLLDRLAEGHEGTLDRSALMAALRRPVAALSGLGELNFLMSDGVHLIAFANSKLHQVKRTCVEHACNQQVIVLTTEPLTDEAWLPTEQNRLHVFVGGQELDVEANPPLEATPRAPTTSTRNVMPKNSQGLSTRCIHAGDQLDPHGAIHTPLYSHSTFAFPNTQGVLDVVEGRASGSLYTRYGLNPTIRSVETKLASVEGGEGAWVFSSGMAAESATFLSFCKAGDHIICIGDVYGGTFELLGQNFPSLGIDTTFLLGSELGQLEASMKENTRIIFFETPTNPNMEVFDIAAISAMARKRGVLTVVDNTFATPVNQSPLALGADLVIHSTTKYLGGHSDLTGGVVIGSAALLTPIWTWRKNLGQMMAPEVAHLLARSLRTLVVRVRAHNASAAVLAERLTGHPRVQQVKYPGLASHPQHELARRQMRGFGGMLSFVVEGDAKATAAVVDRLKLFSIAPSLGGVESLVTQPVTTTHHGLTVEERARRGIVDGLVRISVGLEDADDLWADLSQALAG